MTLEEAMAALAEAGTAQNVKVYTRHGARPPMFGVSFAALGKLKKQIKKDHALALALWDTGNMDARTLALMIIDGPAVPPADIDAMSADVSYHLLVDMLVAEVVMHAPDVAARRDTWTAATDETTKRAGYAILTHMARAADPQPDALFLAYLPRIEADIHTAPNRARQMMNLALLHIGLRNDALHGPALDAARRIGPVVIDHGDTGCKTTDTAARLADPAYVAKERARARRHAPRPKGAKKG